MLPVARAAGSWQDLRAGRYYSTCAAAQIEYPPPVLIHR
jgi:hypothetical protein